MCTSVLQADLVHVHRAFRVDLFHVHCNRTFLCMRAGPAGVASP